MASVNTMTSEHRKGTARIPDADEQMLVRLLHPRIPMPMMQTSICEYLATMALQRYGVALVVDHWGYLNYAHSGPAPGEWVLSLDVRAHPSAVGITSGNPHYHWRMREEVEARAAMLAWYLRHAAHFLMSEGDRLDIHIHKYSECEDSGDTPRLEYLSSMVAPCYRYCMSFDNDLEEGGVVRVTKKSTQPKRILDI